ncbi:hypothetical protein [Thalassotalea fusca]
MIKIQDYIAHPNPELFLRLKCNNLYNKLNPRLADDTDFKSVSLIKKLDKLCMESSSAAYIDNIADGCSLKAARHNSFFNYLAANNYLKLKALITSKPDQMLLLKDEINLLLEDGDLFTESRGRTTQTKFGKELSGRLFKYSTYRVSQFCVETYQELGFGRATCVYCNAERISIVPKRRDGGVSHRIRFDLDHFFPLVLYPYFALSFYNHIPSCHGCNSQIKGEKDFQLRTHIHPYMESFDDIYKFSISATALHSQVVEEVIINETGIKTGDLTVTDLEIYENYQVENENVEELIGILRSYEHLLNEHDIEDFKSMLFNVVGVKQFKKDILSKSNSKLMRDITKLFDSSNLMELD